MYGLTRATITLIAAAAAGLLIWLATQINGDTLGGFWAGYGLIACAGLVMALSQLPGGWASGAAQAPSARYEDDRGPRGRRAADRRPRGDDHLTRSRARALAVG